MTDILSAKEIIKRATLGIPKGIKNAISIVFSVDALIRNGHIISEERTTKNRLKLSCMYKEL